MILNKLPNFVELNLIIKKFISSNSEIWDVGIYGSFIRGKYDAQDLDIVIFLNKNISLSQKTRLAQSLKEKTEEYVKYNLDIKALSIEDFLDKTFLARQGVLSESFLIKRKKFLSELFGFKTFYIFTYSLANLSHSKKILFNYALKGRRKDTGILKEKEASSLGISSILVPLNSTEFFNDFFIKHKIKFKIKKVLIYS